MKYFLVNYPTEKFMKNVNIKKAHRCMNGVQMGNRLRL
jgi:hypothetical protein